MTPLFQIPKFQDYEEPSNNRTISPLPILSLILCKDSHSIKAEIRNDSQLKIHLCLLQMLPYERLTRLYLCKLPTGNR